ncbi:dihydrofolate reductase family protein [Herbiconiux sp. SYSU D00978]|uniref:dihydrofolate reductase family protein n=1 Tax=Herbiconiux sp. SYSU D00978 TaxID=2812562 RepID=UPI001A96709B|nr:dihydrofolate reductase family protein [Herbiconiux sp. SYSU D00978]
MIVRRVHPEADVVVDTDAPDAHERLDELYAVPATTWLRTNLITSVNGSVVGADGTSNPISSRADRAILGAIRRTAELVLVGASSVRVEGYVFPRTADLAVLTRTGDLTGHKLADRRRDGRLLVLCPAAAAGTALRSLEGADPEIVELDTARGVEGAIGLLREAGYTRIVSEGGPDLAGQLLAARLVDELCVATGPVLSDRIVPPFGGAEVAFDRLSLEQLLLDDAGGTYARWVTATGRAKR